MLYGEKYKAIFKLKEIYRLKQLIKNNKDDITKVVLISLAYSLNAYSSRYKVSLEEKLLSLNLNPALLKLVKLYHFKENNIKPSFLFILGFFLGDGTLHVKLE